MAKGIERLIDLLFPPRCAACGALLDFTSLENNRALCDTCLPLWFEEKQEPCGHCLCEVQNCTCVTEFLETAKCDGFYKLVYYRNRRGGAVQNNVIFRIKNKRDRRTPVFLATELEQVLRRKRESGELSLDNACLAYVPRRRSVVLETGTDQARALAEVLAQRLSAPVVDVVVRSRGKQREQKMLSPRDRLKNARASFVLRDAERIKDKTVLLVDDIVTTGASMAACVQKLKRAGAAEVYCVAVASDDINKSPMAPLIKNTDIFSK